MIIENVISAFEVVFSIQTLALMAIGVTGGLIAGAIPGFTIAMAVVLTLPFTFSMPPEQGLATMVSVLVGGIVRWINGRDFNRDTGYAILSSYYL